MYLLLQQGDAIHSRVGMVLGASMSVVTRSGVFVDRDITASDVSSVRQVTTICIRF